MAQHVETLDELLQGSRGARKINRYIGGMSGQQLVQALDEMKVSIHGSMKVLRYRLLRTSLCRADPEDEPEGRVSWYPDVDERREALPVTTANLV